jgi:glucokinase
MILVGDIGGTNTRLAIFSAGDGLLKEPQAEAVFPSGRYESLESIVREFMTGAGHAVENAVFGVAGPVREGRAILTNLPWVVDATHLQETLGFQSLLLVNDVLATAAAVPHLGKGAILTLQEGQADPHGNVAVIAPGTGLGEAFITRYGGGTARAYATEGGHADFGPRNEEESDLWHSLKSSFARVSYERVCSGPGIALIYRYLRDRFPGEEDPAVKEAVLGGADPVPRIAEAALRADHTCPLCEKALRIFTSILGAEAGNLALKVLATGGVYLGGGIPPRLAPLLQDENFLRAFTEKGRMSGLMERIPVHVILEPRAALLGAACLYWEGMEV